MYDDQLGGSGGGGGGVGGVFMRKDEKAQQFFGSMSEAVINKILAFFFIFGYVVDMALALRLAHSNSGKNNFSHFIQNS